MKITPLVTPTKIMKPGSAFIREKNDYNPEEISKMFTQAMLMKHTGRLVRARELLKKLAELKHQDSMCHFAVIIIKEDPKLAREILQELAELKHRDGMFYFAMIIIKENPKLARELLKELHAVDHIAGMYQYAMTLLNGIGGVANTTQAIEIFNLLAKWGHAESQQILARISLQAKVIKTKNTKELEVLFKQAHNEGHHEVAQHCLAMLIVNSNDNKESKIVRLTKLTNNFPNNDDIKMVLENLKHEWSAI